MGDGTTDIINGISMSFHRDYSNKSWPLGFFFIMSLLPWRCLWNSSLFCVGFVISLFVVAIWITGSPVCWGSSSFVLDLLKCGSSMDYWLILEGIKDCWIQLLEELRVGQVAWRILWVSVWDCLNTSFFFCKRMFVFIRNSFSSFLLYPNVLWNPRSQFEFKLALTFLIFSCFDRYFSSFVTSLTYSRSGIIGSMFRTFLYQPVLTTRCPLLKLFVHFLF